MNEGNTVEANGVIVPPTAVAHSNEVKAAKRKTLSQIPVYRASANLMYVVTEIVMRMPNKLRKYSDLMLLDARDLMQAIGYADTSRTDEDRVGYIDCAYVIICGLKCYIQILVHHGIMSQAKPRRQRKGDNQLAAPRIDKIEKLDKDTSNKIDALIRSIIAQLVAWRENPRGQGAPSSPTLKK